MQRKLQITHLDQKFNNIKHSELFDPPPKGWVHSIRKTLNMSLKQLGNKLNITAQSVKEIEEREHSRSITLKNLSEAAEALDMKLVYAIIPKHNSLKKMIELYSYSAAEQIVTRTSNSMSLEDQENRHERIEQAIKDKAKEIENDLPRYIWD